MGDRDNFSEADPPESVILPGNTAFPDDDFPDVRKRLWDLEWRLRRESTAVAEKLQEVLRALFQAPAWSGEAIAEGFMPALGDLRRKVATLESLSQDGTTPSHVGSAALAERIDVLERLVEEGVAAQRSGLSSLGKALDAMASRLEGIEVLENRVAAIDAKFEEAQALRVAFEAKTQSALTEAIEGFAKSLGSRVESLENRIATIATEVADFAEALTRSESRLGLEAEHLTGEVQQRHQSFLDHLGEVELFAKTRFGELEGRVACWDLALEQAASDIVLRLGQLEQAHGRLESALGDKVPAAQFASMSIAAGSQQAAIKDLKAQIARLRTGTVETVSGEGAPETSEGAGVPGTADPVGALWHHIERLETRLGDLPPDIDLFSKDLAGCKRGLKSLMSNWMELEGRLGFFAEKRHLSQLETQLEAKVVRYVEAQFLNLQPEGSFQRVQPGLKEN